MRLVEPTGTVWGRLAAIGDVAVIGAVRARARRDGAQAPFAALAPRLRAADVGFANLESPVGAPVKPDRSSEFWQERTCRRRSRAPACAWCRSRTTT